MTSQKNKNDNPEGDVYMPPVATPYEPPEVLIEAPIRQDVLASGDPPPF